MGDRKIEKEGDPIQREAKIGPLTILSAKLRDRLQAGPTEERNKKL